MKTVSETGVVVATVLLATGEVFGHPVAVGVRAIVQDEPLTFFALQETLVVPPVATRAGTAVM